MSRESIRVRARAEARFVEEATANGTGLYLLGCPIVVLFNDARVRVADPDPGAPTPRRAPPPAGSRGTASP